MTQEEKARAYDDAIERAKSFQEKYGGDYAGYIFPELRESEDERIRKDIVAAVEMRGDLTQGRKSEIYAYLEKQKGQKIVYEDEYQRMLSDSYKCGKDEVVGNPEKYGLQKEQKHPNGCFTCDEYKKGYEAGRLNGFTAGYNKAMKKQKPAEWSEEDEDMLNSCISSIEEAKENRYAYKETDGDTSYDHEIDWLKSLRPVSKESLQPHWKPSEEQMSAFKGYIEDFQAKAEAAVGGWNNFDVMIRLYEQLKKL